MAPVALLSLQQADQVSHTAAVGSSTFTTLGEKFLGTSPWVLALVVPLIVLGAVSEVVRWRRHEGGAVASVALPLLLVPVLGRVGRGGLARPGGVPGAAAGPVP